MGSTAGLTTTLTAVSASTPTAVSGENAAFVVTTEPSMPTEVVELTEAAAATVISPSKSRPYQHRHHHQQYRGWATHHHNRRQQNHQQNSFYTRHQQQSPHYCYYYTEVERAMAEEDCGESYLLRVRPPLPADTTSILRSDSAAVMLPAKNMLPTSPLTSRATTTLSGCSSSPTERTLRGVVAGDYPDSDCAYLSSSGEGGSGFGAVWPLTSERSSPASCPTGTLLSAADTMTVGAQMDGTVGGLRKPTILTTEDVSFIVADAGAAAEDGAGMTATTAARATTEEESVAATSTTAPATTAATIETPTTTSSTDVRDGGVSAGFKEHGSSLNDALACGVSGSSGMSPGGSSAFKRIAWRTRYCCFGCSVKEATLVIAVVFIVIRILNLVCACLAYVQLPDVDLDPSLKTTWFPAILVGNMVDCIFEIVGCVLLLKASKDDNRYLLIPWLVYNSICILYNLIGAIHFFVVSLYVGFAGLVGGLFVIFLSVRIYFFLIVAVYYKLLLEGIIYVVPYPPATLASLGDVELNANRVTVNVALPRSSAHEDNNDTYDGTTARFPVIVTI